MGILEPIRAGVHLGPAFTRERTRVKDGKQYEHVLSETPSLTDRIFQDNTSKQLVDFSQSVRRNPSLSLTEHRFPSPMPAIAKPDNRAVIAEYKEMIKEHVERKILFAFQELIACYQTKLHFESVGAMDQGKSAEAIYVDIAGKVHKLVVRHAAHSCGNPRLIAYDKAQWDDFKNDLTNTPPQGFVYLYATDLYRIMNATMSMPRWMNDADREIEEKTVHSLLRKIGNDIINKSSQGLITPEEGIKEYIQEALNQIQAAKIRLNLQNKDPEVRLVLDYYEKYFTKFQKLIEEDAKFIESLLDIKIKDETPTEQSRRTIFQLRYKAIRDCRINQSLLMQKIINVKEEILKAVGGRKPDHYDAAFNTLLIEHSRTPENKKRFQTLLNFSSDNYTAQYTGSALTKFLNTKRLLVAHQPKIISLARELIEDMRKLRTTEIVERSRSVKVLRGMKKWSQRELGAKLAEMFPNAAASQSTICRIENTGKLVTEPIAMEFSQIFNVDPGLFMPFFYYA